MYEMMRKGAAAVVRVRLAEGFAEGEEDRAWERALEARLRQRIQQVKKWSKVVVKWRSSRCCREGAARTAATGDGRGRLLRPLPFPQRSNGGQTNGGQTAAPIPAAVHFPAAAGGRAALLSRQRGDGKMPDGKMMEDADSLPCTHTYSLPCTHKYTAACIHLCVCMGESMCL